MKIIILGFFIGVLILGMIIGGVIVFPSHIPYSHSWTYSQVESNIEL